MSFVSDLYLGRTICLCHWRLVPYLVHQITRYISRLKDCCFWSRFFPYSKKCCNVCVVENGDDPEPDSIPPFTEYSLEELRAATNYFNSDNIVSESGEKAPNVVYKGRMDNNRWIAVKKFPKVAWPDTKQFMVYFIPYAELSGLHFQIVLCILFSSGIVLLSCCILFRYCISRRVACAQNFELSIHSKLFNHLSKVEL
jgi:hypothetical protein